VPFASRKLTALLLRCHDDRPAMETRTALRLVDSEPVLDEKLLDSGRWIAQYYCAHARRGAAGHDAARGRDPPRPDVRTHRNGPRRYPPAPAGRFIRGPRRPNCFHLLGGAPALGRPPAKEDPIGARILRSLERQGLHPGGNQPNEKDPLRAPSARLRVELLRHPEDVRLPKAERELVAYLELHPGSHNLKR